MRSKFFQYSLLVTEQHSQVLEDVYIDKHVFTLIVIT